MSEEALMSKLMLIVGLFACATLYDPPRMLNLLRPGLELFGSTLSAFNVDRYLPSLPRSSRG
jgi:hypothetical protein